MASQAPTKFQAEVQQHLITFKQYKDRLKQLTGSMSIDQIQQQLGCSQAEAEAIHALWPVYQLGQQDSNNNR